MEFSGIDQGAPFTWNGGIYIKKDHRVAVAEDCSRRLFLPDEEVESKDPKQVAFPSAVDSPLQQAWSNIEGVAGLLGQQHKSIHEHLQAIQQALYSNKVFTYVVKGSLSWRGVHGFHHEEAALLHMTRNQRLYLAKNLHKLLKRMARESLSQHEELKQVDRALVETMEGLCISKI